MKIPKHFCSSSLLSACLCFGGPLFAQGDDMNYRSDCPQERGWFKGKRHHGGPISRIKHALHRLDLSQEQRDKVYAVMDDARPKLRGLMDEMRDQRKTFHDLAMADGVETEEIEAAVDAQSELMKRMMLESVQVRADIFEILTPEQREQAKKQIDKRRRF